MGSLKSVSELACDGEAGGHSPRKGGQRQQGENRPERGLRLPLSYMC